MIGKRGGWGFVYADLTLLPLSSAALGLMTLLLELRKCHRRIEWEVFCLVFGIATSFINRLNVFHFITTLRQIVELNLQIHIFILQFSLL